MTLYTLKPAFQNRLRPLAGRLFRSGITANQVTVAAAIGSILVAALVSTVGPRGFLILPVWLFARMALNALDGMLAREFGQKSSLGAYLNEIGDVVSDAALTLPFALVPAFGALPVFAVVFLALLSEYAGILGPMTGASRRYDGPLGKSDRALLFGALGTWIGLGLPTPSWMAGLMWIVAAALVLTAVNRIRAGLAEAKAPSDLPEP